MKVVYPLFTNVFGSVMFTVSMIFAIGASAAAVDALVHVLLMSEQQ